VRSWNERLIGVLEKTKDYDMQLMTKVTNNPVFSEAYNQRLVAMKEKVTRGCAALGGK
jgi:hypothetical protein